MEKRLPLALILSLLFLWVYMASFPPPQREAGEPAAPGTSPEATTPAVGTASPGEDVAPLSRDGAGRPEVAAVGEAPPRTARLDTSASESHWTSRGAALGWLRLLDYTTEPGSEEPLVLVGAVGGEQGNVLLRDVQGRYRLDERHWQLEEGRDGEGRRQLVFGLEAADGMRFRRVVSEQDEPHTLGLSLEVINGGSERSETLSLVLESARGLVDEEAGSLFYGRPTALVVVEGPGGERQVVKWTGDDLAEGQPRAIGERERVVAVGTMTNYFASLLVPEPGTDVRQVFPRAVLDRIKLERAVTAKGPASEQEAERLRAELAGKFHTAAAADLALLVRRLEPGESQRFDLRLYSGPKAQELAAQPSLGFLTAVIESDYGSLAWINRTLLWILRFFHGIVANWGVAIILLTVLVKGLLFPINRRQQVSMSRYSAVMQRLKPQIDELKAKYKNNTKKFNEEQMKLLREHGATPPLGGCLLMFLQFPIWISLFQILGTSIELRQSGFMLWIDDLSRPDRMPLGLFGMETLNLLPLLMAAATIVQMRFQAKPADESQAQMQKIMGIFMPLMMLWFLYGYSAGLSLYIFTSSMIGIFEFHVIRRIWPVEGLPGPSQGKAGKGGGKAAGGQRLART